MTERSLINLEKSLENENKLSSRQGSIFFPIAICGLLFSVGNGLGRGFGYAKFSELNSYSDMFIGPVVGLVSGILTPRMGPITGVICAGAEAVSFGIGYVTGKYIP
jgi:hypothetical protein